jgi:phosphatidylinositol 4-kinase
METITDAVSVHSLKKEAYAVSAPIVAPVAGEPQQPFETYTLYNHFVDVRNPGLICREGLTFRQQTYGQPSTSTFRRAQDCFMKSLASYSVICYLLQIKDRHNGNILIDREGHVIRALVS